jgi:pimeloyl-ACP methyl ester carboxylesterase
MTTTTPRTEPIRKGDHAVRDDRSMTKTSRSCTPERIRGGTRRRARLIAAVAAAALASVLVPALGAGPAGAAGTSRAVPAIAWHQCPAGSAGAMVGGFVCATVAAPLDYRDRAGPKIRLAVVEHPATGPARRGVIFFNPGGPGGAGTAQLPAFTGFFPKELLREYDIVSWDPRGSGASTAVQCFASAAAESAFLGKYSFFPAGRGQQRGYIRRWREFGKICAARNGALLRHVSTADSARDLNLLRQDLGQAKLNYLGISYGTFLGATYANLFPRRVGRLVLDGNVPPKALTNGGRPNPALSTYLRMRSDKAAAKAMNAFLRICGQRSTRACAFSAGSPTATTAKWGALLGRLRKAPITVGGTAYTYAEVVTTVSFGLSIVQPFSTPVPGNSAPGWPGIAQDLQLLWTARNGRASARPGASAAGAAVTAQRYGGAEQAYAIQCDEAPSPPASAYPGLQHLLLRRSGVIALPYLWSLDEPCATWPVRGQDTYTGPWNAPTSPILVIGNTTDPFLPLRDDIAMTHQLGNARLLVVRGYGHTAFLNPSTCASTYMTTYFQTGALPPKGTACHQNLPPFPPPSG